jgi:dihydroneopterin aldolase
VLHGLVFQGTHGVYPEEQVTPQPFEVDVELALNLQPAGLSDDLEQTVDYAKVHETCRVIVESTRFNLVEALAEAIAHELLADFPVAEVTVRVRKPRVPIEGCSTMLASRYVASAGGRPTARLTPHDGRSRCLSAARAIAPRIAATDGWRPGRGSRSGAAR